jgi:hypothetical protein
MADRSVLRLRCALGESVREKGSVAGASVSVFRLRCALGFSVREKGPVATRRKRCFGVSVALRAQCVGKRERVGRCALVLSLFSFRPTETLIHRNTDLPKHRFTETPIYRNTDSLKHRPRHSSSRFACADLHDSMAATLANLLESMHLQKATNFDSGKPPTWGHIRFQIG